MQQVLNPVATATVAVRYTRIATVTGNDRQRRPLYATLILYLHNQAWDPCQVYMYIHSICTLRVPDSSLTQVGGIESEVNGFRTRNATLKLNCEAQTSK